MSDPVNWVNLNGYEYTRSKTISGSMGTLDFTYEYRREGEGWFPDSPAKTDLGRSTSLLGGTLETTWTDESLKTGDAVEISLGFGKFLGVTFSKDLSTIIINIGLGLDFLNLFGVPFGLSKETESFCLGAGE